MFLEVLLLVAATIASEVVIETYSIAILKRISSEVDKKIKDLSEAAKENRQLVRQETREELKEPREPRDRGRKPVRLSKFSSSAFLSRG